jgi:hypothetical protein
MEGLHDDWRRRHIGAANVQLDDIVPLALQLPDALRDARKWIRRTVLEPFGSDRFVLKIQATS